VIDKNIDPTDMPIPFLRRDYGMLT